MLRPSSPAPPSSSAHSDQPVAAMDADRDERVHGRGAVPGCAEGGPVEGPGGPGGHRQREGGDDPLPAGELQRGDHREQQHGNAQDVGDPQPPRRSVPRASVGAEVSSSGSMSCPGAMRVPRERVLERVHVATGHRVAGHAVAGHAVVGEVVARDVGRRGGVVRARRRRGPGDRRVVPGGADGGDERVGVGVGVLVGGRCGRAPTPAGGSRSPRPRAGG